MVSIISLREVIGRDFHLLPPSLPIHLHLTLIFCLPACQQWVSSLCYSGELMPPPVQGPSHPAYSRTSLRKRFPALLTSPLSQVTSLGLQNMLQFPVPSKQNKTGTPKCLSSVTYSESDPERRIPVKVIYTRIALWMQDREKKAGKANRHMLSLSLDRWEHSGVKIIQRQGNWASIQPHPSILG